MAGRDFRFKQFHIRQDRCGMKVSTDGVLLGAWTPVDGVRRILDIGTGTGLLALMLAQRTPPDVQIEAVELDPAAAAQAAQNVLDSPWASRIRVHQGAIQTYDAAPFDLIVCNPPYFPVGQVASDGARAQARHTHTLSYAELLSAVDRLLTPDGQLALVLPKDWEPSLLAGARQMGFYPNCRWNISPKESKAVNRVLLRLSREELAISTNDMVILSGGGGYSEIYANMTSAFYLKL
ncbi:tRNA1(Val) (adenine(37)-N6)-methyltransferase [Pseudaeromonas paramecii]|uniref:tRNA1(Val) (adenine(37)-N6)-methyltransferase n=1 Tax=Pseudaeromonas paramecii TaxID=2138166 RepID=A0ABP8Q6Z4_9GAMM